MGFKPIAATTTGCTKTGSHGGRAIRIGLIARADQSGLGIQSAEFYRHMPVDQVLLIDVGHLHNDTTHTNKRTDYSLYRNPMVCRGWLPNNGQLQRFTDSVDVVFTCETTYSPHLVPLARQSGAAVVVQPNYEFLNLDWPAPDLWAPGSRWHWDDIPDPKVFLPVPIAADRFTPRPPSRQANHFVHVVGRPAHVDRNGTQQMLEALQHIHSDILVTIYCQTPGYVTDMIRDRKIQIPDNVQLDVKHVDVQHYWELHQTGDVAVLPRRYGGLCLPANEALGAGMPVIMTAIEPNTSWLPDEWLVPAVHKGAFMAKRKVDYWSADVRTLAALMDRFVDDNQFYREARDHAMVLRDEHSWAAMQSMYVETLEEVCCART